MSAARFEPFDYLSSHPQGFPYGGIEVTPEFVREVEEASRDHQDPRALAQWIVERIEEHGAQHARLVFSAKGNGPFCSYCGSIAGLCGHPEKALKDNDEHLTIEVLS